MNWVQIYKKMVLLTILTLTIQAKVAHINLLIKGKDGLFHLIKNPPYTAIIKTNIDSWLFVG